MAVYIDDTGGWGLDALFVGVENTAWSKNATDRAIWFSDIGTANTGFTLPDTEWIVYEVYGMTGTLLTADYTSIATSTKLHGKKEYTDIIGVILTTLNAWRTALDKTNYDTYDIIATHYKGSGKADVYEADETVAFTTATLTDGDFTDHSVEWIMSDDLLASQVTEGTNVVADYDFAAGDQSSWVAVAATPSWTETNFVGNMAVIDNGSWSRVGQTITVEALTLYNIEYIYENKTTSNTNSVISVGGSEGLGFPGAVYNNNGSAEISTTDWVTLTDTFTSLDQTTLYLALLSSSTNTGYFKSVRIWKA